MCPPGPAHRRPRNPRQVTCGRPATGGTAGSGPTAPTARWRSLPVHKARAFPRHAEAGRAMPALAILWPQIRYRPRARSNSITSPAAPVPVLPRNSHDKRESGGGTCGFVRPWWLPCGRRSPGASSCAATVRSGPCMAGVKGPPSRGTGSSSVTGTTSRHRWGPEARPGPAQCQRPLPAHCGWLVAGRNGPSGSADRPSHRRALPLRGRWGHIPVGDREPCGGEHRRG